MKTQWGTKAYKKRRLEEQIIQEKNEKTESGLLFAAVAIAAIYVGIIAGGAWLKTFASHPAAHTIHADSGAVPPPSPQNQNQRARHD